METDVDTIVIDDTTFKSLMSSFPSGVAVVTTADAQGTPRGLTCSSLCSVSLSPPLLLVCIHNDSSTLSAIQARQVFAVNLLHEGGSAAARICSMAGPDRFERLALQPTPLWALPALAAHANLVAECRVWASRQAGDHTILIGEVAQVTTLANSAPLLYGFRRYATWPGHTPDDP